MTVEGLDFPFGARRQEMRVVAVVAAAKRFRDTRAEFLALRSSRSVGRDVGLARQRRDEAISRLVDAFEELDG